jgi:serine/threonine protein kinase/GTPase SAR1 family protein
LFVFPFVAAAIALETQPKDVKKARKREKEELKKLVKDEKKKAATDEGTISSAAEEASNFLQRETEDDDLDKKFTGIVNQATDGIDIHSIKLTADSVIGSATAFDDKGTIQFSCWDFAGQDVYYNTHTFFLTDRSIYLVGFNATHDQEKSFSRVEYWLQSINSRLPGAPIVIFGTHCDDAKCTKSYLKTLEDKIKEKFKRFRFIDIVWIKNTNDTRSKSVQKLLKVLVKIAISKNFKKRLGIDEDCPTSYYHLEERARSLKAAKATPTLKWSVWEAIALAEFGMPAANVPLATQYLHNLGSILWFNEEGLRDMLVLDPQWLTQVFASLVSAKTPITNGVLRHETLPILWKNWAEAVWPFMIVVLEKFEVLHRLEGNALGNVSLSMRLLTDGNDIFSNTAAMAALASTGSAGVVSGINKGISLVPSLLGEQDPSPSDMERAWPAVEEETAELSRVYKFEFLPNGFFSRLMVRLLHSMWSANLFWKYGIVLSKELAHLFLRYDGEKKEITLSVRGPDSGNKMGSLIDSIDTLIADWLKDVQKEIFIPVKLSTGKIHRLDTKVIMDAVGAGKQTVQVEGDSVRIDQIAPDLAMAGAVRGGNLTESDLNIERELGRGGFAIVYRGTLHGEPVAVKKLIFTAAQEESGETTFAEVFGEFRREVWLMSAMQHKNIVSLKGVCTQPNLAMVLEFMESGNLYEYLHNNKNIAWEEKLRLALDVASGMDFMHKQTPPIIHRDLKTPNILLTRRDGGPFPTAKIADFGLSRGLMWQSTFDKKVVDNPVWLAPEVLERKPYTEKVDVYAFGVIMWEIATQTDFFGDLSFMSELERRIIDGERPALPAFPSGYEFYGKLLEACWAQDPAQRPSFEQCVWSLQRSQYDPSMKTAVKIKAYAAPEAPQIRMARTQSMASPGMSSPSLMHRPAAQSVSQSPLQRGMSSPLVAPPQPRAFVQTQSAFVPGRSASSGSIQPNMPHPQPTAFVAGSMPQSPQSVSAPTLDIQQYLTAGTQFMQPAGFMPFAVQTPYMMPPGVSLPPQMVAPASPPSNPNPPHN